MDKSFFCVTTYKNAQEKSSIRQVRKGAFFVLFF